MYSNTVLSPFVNGHLRPLIVVKPHATFPTESQCQVVNEFSGSKALRPGLRRGREAR